MIQRPVLIILGSVTLLLIACSAALNWSCLGNCEFTYAFEFQNASLYEYDPSILEISNGALKFRATQGSTSHTDDFSTESHFVQGTADKVEWDSTIGAVQLSSSGVSAGIGTFVSRTFCEQSPVSWSFLSWDPKFPYGKPLPDLGQSETEYDGERAVMTSVIGHYHFDETGNPSTFADASGNGASLYCANCPLPATGQYNGAMSFDGADDCIEGELGAAIQFPMSLEFWFYPEVPFDGVVQILRLGGTSSDYIKLELRRSSDLPVTIVALHSSGFQVQSNILTNKWSHVAFVIDSSGSVGKTMTLFIDGTEKALTHLEGSAPREKKVSIGCRLGPMIFPFKKMIDELAIYNRALGKDELRERYRRGQTRLKLQVQTCSSTPCSSNTFVGPDGTSNTFYSEAGNAALAEPAFTLTGISRSTCLRYKAFFEGNTSDLNPKLKKVTLRPGTLPLVTGTALTKAGKLFRSLTSFTETSGAGHDVVIRYQLSPDGSQWFYHDGTRWALASESSHTNTASEINAVISRFPHEVGAGNLRLKLFLDSQNGSAQANLQKIEVAGSLQ